MGSSTSVHAFVTSELVDGCALPHFEGNAEERAKEGCNSSDLAVSRPWGYVIPVWWLTLFPFSFIPVDSKMGYYWKKNQKTPNKKKKTTPKPPLHHFSLTSWNTISLSRYRFASYDLLMISFPNSEDEHLRAEDFDACSEGSEAPVGYSDLLIQMCSDPPKSQSWLLGCRQGPSAFVEIELVFLLLGRLYVFRHVGDSSPTLFLCQCYSVNDFWFVLIQRKLLKL